MNTIREELDVLTGRHIQLKVRETEVRGNEGHFYHELQGLSLNGTAHVRTVYFDVGGFVAGRQSRAAAVTVAAAALH